MMNLTVEDKLEGEEEKEQFDLDFQAKLCMMGAHHPSIYACMKILLLRGKKVKEGEEDQQVGKEADRRERQEAFECMKKKKKHKKQTETKKTSG